MRAPDSMRRESALDRADPALIPLLDARRSRERSEEIERLLARATPLVSRIVEQYSASVGALDAEEIAAVVSFRLFRRLDAIASAEQPVIQSFDDYVTRLTCNTIHDHLRSAFPERARLKNKLRHLFSDDDALALWPASVGTVAGLTEWRGRTDALDEGDLDAMRDAVADRDGRDLRRALLQLFDRLNQPARFDAIVTLFDDERPSTASIDPSIETDAANESDRNDLLRALWQEVLQLPPSQRQALLLNLRDPEGMDAIALLIMTGVNRCEPRGGAGSDRTRARRVVARAAAQRQCHRRSPRHRSPKGHQSQEIGARASGAQTRLDARKEVPLSEPHLSAEDLNAFAGRRIDASRVQAIFAHLSSCALCRERSQQALETDRSVERLLEDVAEQRRAPNYWIRVLAACLAIAVIGALLFLLRDDQTAPTTPPVVKKAPPQSVPPTETVAPPVDPVIADAFASGKLTPPASLAALLATPSWERIRGGESTANASYEPNREVVATQRPRFRFPDERGFPSIVRIFDRDREVLHSKPVDSGEWTATADLRRGVTYTWQVESIRDGETVTAPAPPAPPAKFIVLDDNTHRALADARREQPQNHLLLGILSARAGLREDAETHLRSAAQSGDPRVRELLRSVQNWPR